MELASRLIIGTVQFGLDYGISNSEGKPTLNEVEAILNLATENGLSVLDTASAYGNAESIIGNLNNNRFEIVTKFLPESQSGCVDIQLNKSLIMLKQNSVYGLLAHRPREVVRNPEIWEKMIALKNAGKVHKIGFSFDNPDEYYEIRNDSLHPDLVQVPFNYFDNRFESIIEELKSDGCEIHVRSAFLQGLFFANISMLPPYFDEVKEIISSLQDRFDKSLAAGLLRFVLENKYIDKVVIGIQNRNQLNDILETIENAPILPRLNRRINHRILQPSLWTK
jgi:aryl-alcohol dehydrogenase-like predicted oxidoreductase